MARKIQRKELRKPDEFVDLATRILNWIAEHRRALGIGVAALLAIVFGVMLIVHLQHRADVAAARPLVAAVPVRAMPDEAVDPALLAGKQEPEAWIDARKMKAAADGAEQAGLRALADLALAGGELAGGNAAEAESLYLAFLATNPSTASPARLVAQEGLGYALERQGALDKAAEAFGEIGELADGAYRALALYHRGRLAAIAERDEEARKLLEEAKAVEDPRPADVPARADLWLRIVHVRSAGAAASPRAAPGRPATERATPGPAEPAASGPAEAGAQADGGGGDASPAAATAAAASGDAGPPGVAQVDGPSSP